MLLLLMVKFVFVLKKFTFFQRGKYGFRYNGTAFHALKFCFTESQCLVNEVSHVRL